MPRAVLTTLTAYDYKDLQQQYSEKNIINQTTGQEFVISTASKTDLTDIHGRSMTFNAKSVTVGTKADAKDKLVGEIRTVRPFSSNVQDYALRTEIVFSTGDFSIETDQIIVDVNNVSVEREILYDEYLNTDSFMTENAAESEYVVYIHEIAPQYKQNTEYLSTEYSMYWDNATLVFDPLIHLFSGRQAQESTFIQPSSEYVRKRITKLANGHYKIDVSYRIITWWGFNVVTYNKWDGITEDAFHIRVGRQIKFTITANTVQANEFEFDYARPEPLAGGAKGKNYEIASNEFLQTDESTSPNQRQSAILSSEIFSKFDNDRTIVSFILLNCEKYVVDGEERYLRAEDLIYIKDENGEFLTDDDVATGEQTPSVFEIIKTRPIWNGSFEMEVTCRKVDMTT